MTISQQTKDTLKHALISILIGAVVSFITTLLQGLLNYLNDGVFNFSGAIASMMYYLVKRPNNVA